VQRFRHNKTTNAAQLDGGPAKLAGKMTVTEPVIALDGARSIATHRHVRFHYERDDETHTADAIIDSVAPELTIGDRTGMCTLALGAITLVGPTRRYQIDGAALAASHPELHATIAKQFPNIAFDALVLDETAVPDGCTGFVSATMKLDDLSARRFILDGPAVLSAFDEAAVSRVLTTPMWCLVWIAALASALSMIALVDPF
jgi:hypothetical protein